MAQTTTFLLLRTRSTERAGEEFTTPGAVSTDELKRAVNNAYRRLRGMLTASRGAGYYAASANIASVSGTATYALPTDFVSLLAIYVHDGSRARQMAQWEWSDAAHMRSMSLRGGYTWRSWTYRIVGQLLEVAPTPTEVRTIVVRYIPTVADLSNDADTVDGIEGWEEWIVLTVAISLLSKLEREIGPLVQERAVLEAEIKALAGSRDAHRTTRMVSRGHPWSLNPGSTGMGLDGDEWPW